MTIGISLTIFVTCFVIQTLFEKAKYKKGWEYSLIQKFVAGSFNFSLVQAYGCLDEVLFDLVLDTKTNPFNTFFSWASLICAILFVAIGCLLVFFNFWIVSKYQGIKNQGLGEKTTKDLEDFNGRNKYWKLFYSYFNDKNFWSQSFFAILIIRYSLSSLITTVLYSSPLAQTICLLILDGIIILSLIFKRPFSTLRGQLCQFYFEIIILLVHICTFSLSIQQKQEDPSENLRTTFSTGIIYLNTALITGAIGFMFIEIYETIKAEIEAYRLKKQKKTVSPITEESQIITSRPLETTQRQYSEIDDAQNKQINVSVPRLRRVKPSQVSDPSLHLDHSLTPDLSSSRLINRQKDQGIFPITFQNQSE